LEYSGYDKADWEDIRIYAQSSGGSTYWDILNEQQLLLLSMAVNSGSSTYSWVDAEPDGTRMSDQYPYSNQPTGRLPYLMSFFAYTASGDLTSDEFERFTTDKGVFRLSSGAATI
jgi:hypothetical protein